MQKFLAKERFLRAYYYSLSIGVIIFLVVSGIIELLAGYRIPGVSNLEMAFIMTVIHLINYSCEDGDKAEFSVAALSNLAWMIGTIMLSTLLLALPFSAVTERGDYILLVILNAIIPVAIMFRAIAVEAPLLPSLWRGLEERTKAPGVKKVFSFGKRGRILKYTGRLSSLKFALSERCLLGSLPTIKSIESSLRKLSKESNRDLLEAGCALLFASEDKLRLVEEIVASESLKLLSKVEESALQTKITDALTPLSKDLLKLLTFKEELEVTQETLKTERAKLELKNKIDLL